MTGVVELTGSSANRGFSRHDGIPLTITAAAKALRDGSWTATALLQAVQRRAEAVDSKLGVFIARTDETALQAAALADDELSRGIDRGPLHGVPLGIKDNICVEGVPTTAQSKVDTGFGGRGDATVVRRLRRAGAVITGKTTLSEYSLALPDESKGFPTPRNPFDPTRWSGGSSSGTASGIQAGCFLGGLGTDTGGSVRIPASWCGISGLKPTYGLVPKSGIVPLAWSHDVVGPMARSAEDCASLLAQMSGHDPTDPASVRRDKEEYGIADDSTLRGFVVGVDLSMTADPLRTSEAAQSLLAAVDVCESLGAEIRHVELPMYAELKLALRVGMSSEAFAYHRTSLASHWDDYGIPARAAITPGSMVSAADYMQIQRVRRLGVAKAIAFLQDIDIVLTPTTLIPAPALQGIDSSIAMSLTTEYWSALGFPAMSIPMAPSPNGLPLGLHLGGRPYDEKSLLRVAAAFQRVTDYHLDEAPLFASGADLKLLDG